MDGTSEDDDDVDLDRPLGGPLHPDDRLWRHPSELAASAAATVPPPEGHPAPAGRWGRFRSQAAPAAPVARRRGHGLFGLWLPVALAGTVGALLAAGLLTVTGLEGGTDEDQAASGPSSTLAIALASRTAPLRVAELAERLRPSLLAVSAIASDGRATRGSAVAIRAGHVLTAARLVADSHDLQVLVRGVGRRAVLVGADRDTDLAVLAVDGAGLVPVSWGAAADLRPGDPAVAVSTSPVAGPGPTVTAGIISGIARTLAHAGTELRGLLQVDRPVPDEGAGGALLDPAGSLVGITLPAATGGAPFGYAVPAEIAREVARQLLTGGRVAHPWLGVEGGDKGMGGGALIQRVKPGSPAAAAGLLDGDVITEVDGRPTPSMGMLLLALRRHQPGETVRLLVLRGDRTLSIAVTLVERP